MARHPRKPFTTDGCSGGMSWLFMLCTGKPPPWQQLCVEHDRKYWAGGSRLARRNADQALLAAMITRGNVWWGLAMYVAVRAGGHPLLPFSWRWGYGYGWPRGYT